jgi:hypothetical protein
MRPDPVVETGEFIGNAAAPSVLPCASESSAENANTSSISRWVSGPGGSVAAPSRIAQNAPWIDDGVFSMVRCARVTIRPFPDVAGPGALRRKRPARADALPRGLIYRADAGTYGERCGIGAFNERGALDGAALGTLLAPSGSFLAGNQQASEGP